MHMNMVEPENRKHEEKSRSAANKYTRSSGRLRRPRQNLKDPILTGDVLPAFTFACELE